MGVIDQYAVQRWRRRPNQLQHEKLMAENTTLKHVITTLRSQVTEVQITMTEQNAEIRQLTLELEQTAKRAAVLDRRVADSEQLLRKFGLTSDSLLPMGSSETRFHHQKNSSSAEFGSVRKPASSLESSASRT